MSRDQSAKPSMTSSMQYTHAWTILGLISGTKYHQTSSDLVHRISDHAKRRDWGERDDGSVEGIN